MEAAVRSEGRDPVLTVRGSIDVATLEEFRGCLAEAEARTPGGQELRLDLRGVTFISAAALGRIATVARRLDDRGARLRLQPSPPVARVVGLLHDSGRLPPEIEVDLRP